MKNEHGQTRRMANLEIVARLLRAVMDRPHERFGQILRNTGVVNDYMVDGEHTPRWCNHFNEEPYITILRMNERENERKEK